MTLTGMRAAQQLASVIAVTGLTQLVWRLGALPARIVSFSTRIAVAAPASARSSSTVPTGSLAVLSAVPKDTDLPARAFALLVANGQPLAFLGALHVSVTVAPAGAPASASLWKMVVLAAGGLRGREGERRREQRGREPVAVVVLAVAGDLGRARVDGLVVVVAVGAHRAAVAVGVDCRARWRHRAPPPVATVSLCTDSHESAASSWSLVSDVGAVAAGDQVGDAVTRGDRVVVGSADEQVGARAAVEDVAAGVAVEQVVAGRADQRVVARAAVDALDVTADVVGLPDRAVVGAARADGHPHGRGVGRVAQGVDAGAAAVDVDAEVGGQRVVAGAAVELVVPEATVEDVIAVVAEEQVVAGVGAAQRVAAGAAVDLGVHADRHGRVGGDLVVAGAEVDDDARDEVDRAGHVVAVARAAQAGRQALPRGPVDAELAANQAVADGVVRRCRGRRDGDRVRGGLGDRDRGGGWAGCGEGSSERQRGDEPAHDRRGYGCPEADWTGGRCGRLPSSGRLAV